MPTHRQEMRIQQENIPTIAVEVTFPSHQSRPTNHAPSVTLPPSRPTRYAAPHTQHPSRPTSHAPSVTPHQANGSVNVIVKSAWRHAATPPRYHITLV